MKYKFSFEERERIDKTEEWIADNPDEAAVRIVYLESLIGVGEAEKHVD